jgi:hypothetical protein
MKNKNESSFVDPIRKPWVGAGLFVLLITMLPIWPLQGNWWGIPSWSVFALLASFLTSVFIAFVILCVWKDPDEPAERKSHD